MSKLKQELSRSLASLKKDLNDPVTTIDEHNEIIRVIRELKNSGQDKEVVPTIVEASKNPATNPQLVALALAYACRSVSGAYSAVNDCCTSSKTLLHFVCYFKGLRTEPKKGGGHGFRQAVKKWYDSHDAKSLAKIFIAEKRVRGWSHRDVIKISHFKPSNPEVEAVVQYFLFHKEEAHNKLSSDLQTLAAEFKDLKNSDDPQRVAYLLQHLQLPLTYLPVKFKDSVEFWTDYSSSLPINTLVKKLEYLSSCKRFSSSLKGLVLSLLETADPSAVDPTDLFIAMHRYKGSVKSQRKQKQIEKQSKAKGVVDAEKALNALLNKSSGETKVQTGPLKPCPDIEKALNALLSKSLGASPRGEIRWLVVINFKDGGGRSYHPGFTVADAAAFLIVWAFHTGKSVKICPVDKNSSIHITAETSSSDVATTLRQVTSKSGNVKSAFKWALDNKHSAECILFLSDATFKKPASLKNTLTQWDAYREGLQIPQSKLCIFGPSGTITELPSDALFLQGLSSRTPLVIESFVKDML